ncbi:MAG: nucleoside hydrolase [Dysgonamonadaceae bacterium]|jgi:inosine-uridine nucleoside N-ribohydrolase|nr:nucleoside hydrolase [Dysgonamonadaceae bacterium]
MKTTFFKYCIFLAFVSFSCTACDKEQTEQQDSAIANVIFDTDMGSDCDDAGALALLHSYADIKKVNILGVIYSSGKNKYGAGVCDAINTWYGRGDLPLGQYKGDDVGDPNNNYSRQIAENTTVFPHNIIDSSDEMVEVYKRILREQPDSSVTVITVGHPHGLCYLMNDEEGMSLIKRKVQKCISMTGTNTTPGDDWNFAQAGVAPYISDILDRLPVAHYFSGAGTSVLTGHRLLPNTPENNPVREAYRLYGASLISGRPSWDQIAVLFAIKPELFEVDSVGSLVQNERNQTYWDKNSDNPRHKKINPVISDQELEKLIEDRMSRSPLKK